MRRVHVQSLTVDSFHSFGAFAHLQSPSGEFIGEPPIEFFRDMLPVSFGQCSNVAFSTCRVMPRPLMVDVLEYHSRTGETMMCMDDDMILQAAPASAAGGSPPLDRLRAFHVPKLAMVMLRPGVWHHAPFALSNRPIHVLVALPERTYANDCTVIKLSEFDRVELVFSRSSG